MPSLIVVVEVKLFLVLQAIPVGLSLSGNLLTAVQENLPIKVVVFNNGKLAFIDIEQNPKA